MNKIKNLGQVFTPEYIVEKMLSLSKNNGKILEPSAGDGAFSRYINEKTNRHITSIEIDEDNKMHNFIIMDFFDFDDNNKYPTILGNPPYVAYKNITTETLKKIKDCSYLSIYDNRTNLYIYFIRKCVEHLEDNGELIFITPRDFIKSTAAIKLNNFLYENGTITDWVEYGDINVFKGYSPNVAIWRYEKGNFSRRTQTNEGIKNFILTKGQLTFINNIGNIKFSDLFFVKVGAVSGKDSIFTHSNGNVDFVCSFTKRTGKLKRMFYNVYSQFLVTHKDLLINRKIKKFDESNWWTWGRSININNESRIYVNCKTRDLTPFFTHDCKYYDGSVLAIYPKYDIDIKTAVDLLNHVNWSDLGFKVGGRLCFTQKSLENILLPNTFKILTDGI
jgi:adenine-specific DNA-methyltransferase